MVIVSKAILRDFAEKHPRSKAAVYNWYDTVAKAEWKNFSEMKNTFNSADAVGNDRYVFDLKGNHFRLIALIIFKVRTVFILFVGTHEEYDKIDAKTVVYKRY
ncbi:MAG: type II toxin-antitoxin system HigB family toxin [Chitinophagia bacterium]|jgi:mRNA interferase HigB